MKQSKKNENKLNTLENVNIQMHMEADGATQILAQALLAQAEANEANSDAIMQLAKALKPIDVCAIKMSNAGINLSGELQQ